MPTVGERKAELFQMPVNHLVELIINYEDRHNTEPSKARALEKKVEELQARIELESKERQTRISQRNELKNTLHQKQVEIDALRKGNTELYQILLTINQIFRQDIELTNEYVKKLLNGEYVTHSQLDDIAEENGW